MEYWPDILLIVAAVLVAGSMISRAVARGANQTPFRDKTRPHDVFISYRSHDVALARAVGEILIASGMKPWFAEYEVHFRGREDDEYINGRIDQACRACAWGVVISSATYWDSKYCVREVDGLLESKSQENVLHVQVGARAVERLRDCPTLVIDDPPQTQGEARREAQRVIAFIAEHTKWGLAPVPTVQSTSTEFDLTADGLPFRVRRAAWRVDDNGMSDGGLPKLSLATPTGMLRANVAAGPERSPEALEARLDRRRKQDAQSDDRELARALVATAERHIAALDGEIIGVHLYWQLDHAQFALTYRHTLIWTRKYSIIAVIEPFEDVVEFVFTFGYVGSFDDFMALVPEMDATVESLRLGPSADAPPAALLGRAFQAVEAGNDARALLLLGRALDEDPQAAHVHNEAGVCLFRLGRHRAALKYAERAKTLDPNEPKFQMSVLSARFELIRAEREGSASEVLHACERFNREHPDYPSGYLLNAQVLAYVGEPRESWEASLEAASKAYSRAGRMASGTPLDSRRVQMILDGVRKNCERMAHSA